jgi:pimeloyl-ACP methyl ester carboxylesterase
MNPLLQHPASWVISGGIVSAFAILNILAYRHARAMVTFRASGEKTPQPEALSSKDKLSLLLSGVVVTRPENDATPADVDLEFSTHYLNANDVRLEAWFMPHSNPRAVAVLFHGYAASKAQRLPEARELHDMGCSVVLVDFRGSGGSDLSSTSVGYHEADEVMAAVDFARSHSNQKPVIVFGLSMGGAAILRAASKLGLKADLIIIEGVFDNMLSTVKNRFASMGLPSFPAALFLTFWGGVQQRFSAFGHNPADYACDVDQPTLMLHGEHDPRATLAQADSIYRNLAGPKHLEQFDGGHESCLSVAPEQWRQTVGSFLDQYLKS